MAEILINDITDPDIAEETLQSTTRTITRRYADSALITGVESTRRDSKSTYKALRKKTTEEQLRTLARISEAVSKALNIYQGFTNSGWDIVADSDRGTNALRVWFEEMEDRGINPNNLINEEIYDLYVLGGTAFRTVLINDEPQFIRNIPPEEISFLHQVDPDPANVEYGKIWYTGFYLDRAKREFVVLESIVDPNPYFYYAPMLTTSKTPKGISIIESVIDLAISAGEKNYMMTEYLRGNIFPHEIVSIILDPYFEVLTDENVEFDIEKFNEVKQKAVDQVTKFMEEGDSTQTLVADVEIRKIVVGTLEGANLRGLPDINDDQDARFPRALKVPGTLLGQRRQGSALNDNQTRYEIRAIYKNILNIRTTLRRGWEKLCTSYLTYRGIRGKGGIAFTDTDIELKQAITEAVKSEADAAKVLVDIRAFTPAEIREAFTRGALDLTQFDADMPPELEAELANSQQEESDDSESEDTGTEQES